MTIEFERENLPQREFLARGGMGEIYLVKDLVLDDVAGPLVYKEFNQSALDMLIRPEVLSTIVQLRLQMEEQERLLLDQLAIWPCRIVVDGTPKGLLMRVIGNEFFFPLHYRTGKVGMRPCEIQYLLQDQELCKRLNVPYPNVAQRVRLLREFAYALAFLHKRHLTFGDISGRNAVYSLEPTPRVLLVDCDAVRVAHNPSAFGRQPHSPDYEPPESMRVKARLRKLAASDPNHVDLPGLRNRYGIQNSATDVYKFALFVLRCLRPGPGCSVEVDPSRVDGMLPPAAALLLRASLADDPKARPTAKEWVQALDGKPIVAPALPTPTPTPPPGPDQIGRWKRGADGSWQRTAQTAQPAQPGT